MHASIKITVWLTEIDASIRVLGSSRLNVSGSLSNVGPGSSEPQPGAANLQGGEGGQRGGLRGDCVGAAGAGGLPGTGLWR